MNDSLVFGPPTRLQLIKLRIMILIGMISVLSFFIWFLSPDFVGNSTLYWLIFVLLVYDVFRIIYMWYHYWNISIPEKPKVWKPLTVDVFTTYFPGEPIEMVTETLLAIVKIKYPHTTYLCDEANHPELKAFCKKHNIVHVTRTNRVDAKAGNINNALQQAKGELCLILDPDHIPDENFLDEVIPYFADDSIGFVQTVQAYYNVNESKVAKGAAQQTFHFYGPLMMGMNSYGTVNAIGANCVFRREALDSIGGHASGLSEDLHTAMRLHAQGWRSIYLPKSLTKGLVPATLTSYYQQQLKWSKGTLELLLKVYPKLFKKFTWRQKIHYGILPFHYFSGIAFFIWLLIPIISLNFSISPYRADLVEFLLHVAPILVSFIAIRLSVQNWVIHKSERGLHLLGGILFQCTWWVYVIGVIYNVIGKNLVYLPTEKSDFERTHFKVVLPNIIVFLLSLSAIYYGLAKDFTPYSIAMAGFAFWNALIMLFTLVFAYEKRRMYKFADYLNAFVFSKKEFIRQLFYGVGKKTALLMLLLTVVISSFLHYQKEEIKQNGIALAEPVQKEIKYLGVFSPKVDNGITTVHGINEFADVIDEKLSIASFYYAWNPDKEFVFSSKVMDSVYQMNAVPMITWEPWNNYEEQDLNENKHVFDLVNEGYFDAYLKASAIQFKSLKRPVFLRFAHEFDNPFYPWFDERKQASEVFIEAWRHVYDIFKANGVQNVVWIWNPWRAEHVAAYYPGEDVVDWIGVNILNYASDKEAAGWASFKELYDSFHNEIIKLPKTPIIISEFGSLRGDGNQDEWFKEAYTCLKHEFDEIKAIVYFNSDVDNNMPDGFNSPERFNWKVANKTGLEHSFKAEDFSLYEDYLKDERRFNFNKIKYLAVRSTEKESVNSVIPHDLENDRERDLLITNAIIKSKNHLEKPHSSGAISLKNVHGVNFKKGENWKEDFFVLDRRTLVHDFSTMSNVGINVIKFKENSVYDRNVLNISEEFGIKVCYGFNLPVQMDFIKDTLLLKEIQQNILHKVRRYKEKSQIIAWNLQNDVLSDLGTFYYKPELLIQKQAYLNWLGGLIEDIKRIDASRPVILDLKSNNLTNLHARSIEKIMPNLDYIGLKVKDSIALKVNLEGLEKESIPYVFSEIPVEVLAQDEFVKDDIPFFVSFWQDQQGINNIAFEGLIDRKNRYKKGFFQLQNLITPKSKSSISSGSSIHCNILKPTKVTHSNRVLTYHAFIQDESQLWVPGYKNKQFSYEWELVKCDAYGNYLAIQPVGNLPYLKINIPENNEDYRLVLTVSDGEQSSIKVSNLNTPYSE
ncbi:glycosyltransferase family 2 protein [Formosa sp. S-31]|uniref:glycosyltransferase family 2 protein n=1 Tax=Formosa sp. S-31 TaxID=2790949 RepID=UPI003EBC984C